MNRSLVLLFSVWLAGLSGSKAQTVELLGKVLAEGDIENIHVINSASRLFTTTNANGFFAISAKYGDSLKFTSVRYKTKIIPVSYKMIQEQQLEVYLEDQINVLDEVIVGKVLTGKLDSDIENSEAERPIDFYDLGIPGYVGVPLTQSERRLAEASKGQPGTIPILPFLNAITGRTKMLKERVRLERNSKFLEQVKARYSEVFFDNYPLASEHREEFFYFVEEDPSFEARCLGKSDLHVLSFLEEKRIAYLENLKEKAED